MLFSKLRQALGSTLFHPNYLPNLGKAIIISHQRNPLNHGNNSNLGGLSYFLINHNFHEFVVYK